MTPPCGVNGNKLQIERFLKLKFTYLSLEYRRLSFGIQSLTDQHSARGLKPVRRTQDSLTRLQLRRACLSEKRRSTKTSYMSILDNRRGSGGFQPHNPGAQTREIRTGSSIFPPPLNAKTTRDPLFSSLEPHPLNRSSSSRAEFRATLPNPRQSSVSPSISRSEGTPSSDRAHSIEPTETLKPTTDSTGFVVSRATGRIFDLSQRGVAVTTSGVKRARAARKPKKLRKKVQSAQDAARRYILF